MKQTITRMNNRKKSRTGSETILLVLMPFWDALIPPMGISCLKGFLQWYGYRVKGVDLNVETSFKETYDSYFEHLKGYVPENKRSNLYNIGKDVLRNHMMAHLHYENESEYIALTKELVRKTFFCDLTDLQVLELNRLLSVFYQRLRDHFLQLLEQEKPGMLGVSVFKGTLAASLFAFRLTKEYYPHITTVMGGGIFADQLAPDSPDWQFFLKKTPYIDKIIIGEGEQLFLKLLGGQLPQSQKVFSLKDIQEEIIDISSAVLPDFSDLNLQHYPYLASYASRSCPYQCSFCSETVRWGNYRKKSAQQVSGEFIQLYETYGRRLFLMTDSLLNPVITGLTQELIQKDLIIYWDGYLRVDDQVCDVDTTLQWRKAGFYRARLGVESGSQKILAGMNKKITPAQIKKAVSNLAHAGIKTTTYWIVGYPGETEADFRQTLELLAELRNDIYEAEFNAFWYFSSGQVNSDVWAQDSALLFPETAGNMLLLPTRILKKEPSREETHHRMKRFQDCCIRLGIPNPYSLYDIYQADERWKRLHKNAVPPLVQLRDDTTAIDERKQVKKWFTADADIHPFVGDEDWNF